MKRQKKGNELKILLSFLIIAIIAVVCLFVFSKKNGQENVRTKESNVFASTNTIDDNNTIGVLKNTTNNENETNETTEKEPIIKGEKLGKEGLPVLMYHFFYDASKGEYARDGNWIEISNFEDHLNYLVENDYYFPTWEEVSKYIDGEIDLPKKSIVLTTDDGEETFFKTALPVIKKYDVKITEFLVTSWNGWFKHDYPAKQVSYQSHSDNMHKAGSDGKGVMTSWSYEKILNDCKESRKVLDNEAIAFCYPFGQFNETSKKAVKDAGFELAFTTEVGKVKVGSDKLELPRIRTSTKTNLDIFKKIIQ